MSFMTGHPLKRQECFVVISAVPEPGVCEDAATGGNSSLYETSGRYLVGNKSQQFSDFSDFSE